MIRMVSSRSVWTTATTRPCKAKRDKMLLIMGQPIILHRDRVSIKHRLNAEEINTVLLDIGQALASSHAKRMGIL